MINPLENPDRPDDRSALFYTNDENTKGVGQEKSLESGREMSVIFLTESCQ